MIINRNESTTLKGISIFIVILSHLLGKYANTSEIFRNALGTGGVAIFFILSGYGLYSSYKMNGLQVKRYWNNKIQNIFVPYTIVTIIFYFLFKREVGATLLCKNIFCIDYTRAIDGTMWYMSLLLIWYLLFFCVFYFEFGIIIKLLIMLLFAKVIIQNYSFFQACGWQFSVNALAFPIGLIIGFIDNEISIIKPIITSKITYICLFVVSCATYYYSYNIRQDTFVVLGIELFVVMLSFVKILNMIHVNATFPLSFIGKYSFSAYLVEAKLLDQMVRFNIQSKICNLIVYFILLSILCGLLEYKKIYSYIKKNIGK